MLAQFKHILRYEKKNFHRREYNNKMGTRIEKQQLTNHAASSTCRLLVSITIDLYTCKVGCQEEWARLNKRVHTKNPYTRVKISWSLFFFVCFCFSQCAIVPHFFSRVCVCACLWWRRVMLIEYSWIEFWFHCALQWNNRY